MRLLQELGALQFRLGDLPFRQLLLPSFDVVDIQAIVEGFRSLLLIEIKPKIWVGTVVGTVVVVVVVALCT